MKRYTILFSITVAAVAGIFLYGYWNAPPEEVNVATLKTGDAYVEVVCTGRVEEADQRQVFAETPVYSNDILVREGDRVIQGQELLRVDREQTLQAMADVYSGALDSQTSQVLAGILQGVELEEYLKEHASSVSGLTASIPQTVRSPITGTVRSVGVQAGALTDSSKPLFTIAASEKLQIRLTVGEAQISDIQEGQKVTITGAGFKSVYSGTVKKIASTAKQVSSGGVSETVVEVLVEVDEAGEDIKPGFTATARILVENLAESLVVPYEAVREDDEGHPYVYVVRNSSVAKAVLATGKELEEGYQVLSGLEEGDKVVLNPEKVSLRQRVRAVEEALD